MQTPLASFARINEFQGHTGIEYALHCDGSRVVSAGYDGIVEVRDTDTGELI